MKRIIQILIVIMFVFMFVSCDRKEESCNHNWDEATCIAPKTCSICNETEGTKTPYNHSFVGDECILCGRINLTLANYEEYIEYNAYVDHKEREPLIYCTFNVKGNPHYEYNGVRILVNFAHYDSDEYYQHMRDLYYGTNEAEPYDESKCYVNLNVAGNGSNTTNVWWSRDNSASVSDTTTFEIVEISGTLDKY